MDTNINHFRGWEVALSTGQVIREGDMEWTEVPKQDIVRLTQRYDGREWNIDNKKEYYQKKQASVIPSIPGSFQIESRSIGYYEGNSKVLYTIDEHTGRMKMEIKDII